MRKFCILSLLILQSCAYTKNRELKKIDVYDLHATDHLIHHIPVLEIPKVGTVKASNGICKISEDGPFNLVRASINAQVGHRSRLVIEQGCTVYIDFGAGIVIDIKNADHGSDVVFYINGSK